MTAVATIDEGFALLSSSAFALWIRLMTVPNMDLMRGRRHLARVISWPKRTCDRCLAELRNKGFIIIGGRKGHGRPSTVYIAKRAVLVGPDHFVKLS